MQWLLGKQVLSCADITCLKHETDELVEYLSRHMETLRCGQPAGMTTNLFSLAIMSLDILPCVLYKISGCLYRASCIADANAGIEETKTKRGEMKMIGSASASGFSRTALYCM